MESRDTLTIFGFELGTYNGCDYHGDLIISYYQFKPSKSLLKSTIDVKNKEYQSLTVDYESSEIKIDISDDETIDLKFQLNKVA